MSDKQKPAPSNSRRSFEQGIFRTLIFGKGKPRIRIRSLLLGSFWCVVVWLLYPYALGISAWDSSVRFVGVALLVLVALITLGALSAFARVLWHMGLLWLVLTLMVLFTGATIARGRTIAASDSSGWIGAARLVVRDINDIGSRITTQISSVPANVYMATTAETPFWQAESVALIDPVSLDTPASGQILTLPSERDPDGITRGVLTRVVTDDKSNVNLRVAPGMDNAVMKKLASGKLVIVVDGPLLVGDQIWWKVSDTQDEGWCLASLLVFVSR